MAKAAMIDLKRLGFFTRIAEDGSLSKAAKSLHIAQPALSRQVHTLEEYLGFKLFTRTSRGMQLTREGALLHGAIVGPLRDLELAVQNMRSFMSRAGGDIGLGIHPGLGPILARPLIERLRSEFPNIRFRFLEGPSNSQIHWLKHGVVDFALLDHAITDKQLRAPLLVSEELVLVSAEGDGESLAFREVVALPLVLPCSHHGVRKVVDDAVEKAGLSLNLQFEADSLSLIEELIRDGSMHTLLPHSLAQNMEPPTGLAVRRVSDVELHVGTYLGTRNYADIEESVITKIDRTIQNLVIDRLNPSSQS